MRLDPAALERIDNWKSSQKPQLTRAEAVRQLLDIALNEIVTDRDVRFSDGELLIITMLCELQKGLKVKGEIEPGFVQEVIHGGHYWAMNFEYSGLFHEHRDSSKTLSEVLDILEMWDFLEMGGDKLSSKDKKFVEEKTEGLYNEVRFHGFDGNNEGEHMSIASFLVNKMGRFSRFKGRDLNSHCPLLDNYRKMLSVFTPIRPTLIGFSLNIEQIIMILNSGYK